MCKLCLGRHVRFLLVMVLASPFVMPLSARKRPAAPKIDEKYSPELASIIDRVIANEAILSHRMKNYTPRVETYLQYYRPDPALGDVPTHDARFLGRLKFGPGAEEVSFVQESIRGWLRSRPKVLIDHLNIDDFAVEPMVLDIDRFDRSRYAFQPVRWEYLGDVRCLAIDVFPKDRSGMGAFKGRIWVEDQNYAIVRLNGTRVNPARWRFYVHFDCWRENLQPGMWLPVYIYSQETDLGKKLRYKAETRLWGYDLSTHSQSEWSTIQVDAPAPVRDNTVMSDMTPVESERQLTMDAEHNVLDRLEKARLIAPPGPVDKVLETVVNNLIVTNHLDNLPPIHCRVMLTSSLESFSLAYTIVVSKGLIDVLPDEPSLAMVLSHELAHIALGHKLNTKYAFNDRMQISDEQLLSSLDLARSRQDEIAADTKGIEFLKTSPYKDNLAQAGLFLRAAVAAAPATPHMFGAHLGNGLLEGNDKLIRMATLMGGAPALAPKDVKQIAALPLGSRIEVNAWDGSTGLTTRKAVAIVDSTEKMPFRVTPLVPYLRTYQKSQQVSVSAQNGNGNGNGQ